MLLGLRVKNFALIREASLSFEAGFTVLSGETGAGKSILIDSISALLGAKTGRDTERRRGRLSGTHLFGTAKRIERAPRGSFDCAGGGRNRHCEPENPEDPEHIPD